MIPALGAANGRSRRAIGALMAHDRPGLNRQLTMSLACGGVRR
jgi:hypothetical protein